MAGGGLVIGVIAALVVTRLLRGVLAGLNAADPMSVAVAAALVMVIAATASLLPARRATRVNPMVALRP